MATVPIIVRATQRMNFPDGKFIPEGTLGIHLGRKTHFDLGPLLFCGFGGHHLPVIDDLKIGVQIQDQGPWDGTQGAFTTTGWNLNPILSFRRGTAR